MTINSNSISDRYASTTSQRAAAELCVVQPAITWDGGPLPGVEPVITGVRTLRPIGAKQTEMTFAEISEKFHAGNYLNNSPQVRDETNLSNSEVRQNYVLGAIVGCVIALGIVMTGMLENVNIINILQ